MAYTAAGSRRSAELIVRLLLDVIPIKSILDVGCANGTWLRTWRDFGVNDIHGLDGDYVDRTKLEIAEKHFTPADLTHDVSLGRTFDLVQSLEVAEHIEPAFSKTFIDTITRHSGGLILFSAAPPGQGGEHHVNEKTYEFWRSLFAKQQFVAFDYIRPKIIDDQSIAYWYRFNTVLYARANAVDQLPAAVRETRIPDEAAIPDLSPLSFKVRKAIVRWLPRGTQTGIARLKARLVNAASSVR
jgi:SAM-dependent methyltransferase